MTTPISGTCVERIRRTDTIESFRFQLGEQLEFAPGQCLKLIFDLPNLNNRELNKFLSFSSAPQAAYIEVTKRLSGSAFSEKLRQLKNNDTVSFLAPYGQCVFREEYQKIGFLVGGIGITPVISILKYIALKEIPVDVCLLYVNRNEQDIAFKDELLQLSKAQGWQVCLTVDELRPRSSGIRFGRIGQALVEEVMPDVRERVIFSFGPPVMVKAMKDMCLNSGCRPENLKTEIFAGY